MIKLTFIQFEMIKDLIYDKIDQTDSDYYRELLKEINNNNK
jgi:hypothetical protein